MDKEYLTKLTSDLYKLTLLFPKKEPLRYKMRELADSVLTNLILLIDGAEVDYSDVAFEIRKDVEPLNLFFEIAKDQNWVSQNDIADIQERYQVIKEEIQRFSDNIREDISEKRVVQEKRTPVASLASLNSRQKKIIDLLREREKMQVREVQEIFPQVTKRTLRRDFDALTKEGTIERVGKANLTYYKMADNEI